MRKNNLGNTIVKKAITWAMVVAVAGTSIGGNASTLTVYASEQSEVVTEVPDMLKEDVRAAVDAAAEATKEAQAAANTATEAVESIENINIAPAQSDLSDAKESMTETTTKANNAATDAGVAKDTATGQATAAKEDLTEAETIVAESGTKVAEEQAKVDAAAQAVTDLAEGKTEEVKKAVAEKAEAAQIAANEAKAALEEALLKDNAAAAQTEVDKVNEAAQKAAQAVGDAEAIVEAAQAELDTKKAEFEAVKEAAKEVEAGYEEKLAAKQKEIADLEALLADAENKYAGAVEAAKAAETAATEAQALAADANNKIQTESQTASEAATSATQASTTASNKADLAEEKAEAVANMHVTPAQNEVDAAQEVADEKETKYNAAVTQETADKEAADKAYNQTVSDAATAKASAYSNAETERADKKVQIEADSKYAKNINEATQNYNSKEHEQYWFFGWHCYSDCEKCAAYDELKAAEGAKKNDLDAVDKAYNDAVAAADKAYNDAVTKAETAKSNAYSTAENNTLAAQNEMNAAKVIVEEKRIPLDKEKGTRDAILSAMTDDVEANQTVIDTVSAQLGTEGAQYLEYMNDLNAYIWASEERNGSWLWEGSWWSGEDLKVKIETKYGDGFWEDLWNIIAIDKVKNELTDSKATAERLVKELQEKEATLQSKQSAVEAAKAATTAADAAQTAATKATAVANAAEAAQTAKNEVDAAVANVTTKKAEVEALKAQLEAARKDYNAANEAAKALATAKLELTEAEAEVKAAQAKFDETQKNLQEAKAAQTAAENYAKWANALVETQYTSAFAQATIDENGNKVASTENLKNYDLTDKEVVSRPTTDFVPVSGKESIEVPYQVYRAFVEAMYELSYDTIKNVNQGKGISTGDTTMNILYWNVDENGQLTGEYFTTVEELTSGRYFVAYVFKIQSDGYHLDGVMYDYTAPSVDPTPVDPTPVDPTPGDDTPVIIEDGPVALTDAPAVLGANRAAEAPAVLGARRDDYYAVLGERRNPATGDSLSLMLWAVSSVAATGVASVAGTKIFKRRKKDN